MTVKTIVLRGAGIRKEAIAGGTITPGYLVERDSSGDFIAAATAGDNVPKLWCVENEVVGLGIDTDYVALDTCLAETLQPGSEVFALLGASAAAVLIGNPLESAGDGTVRLHVPVAIDEGGSTDHGTRHYDAIVGYALEDVDNSGGGSEARLKLEVT